MYMMHSLHTSHELIGNHSSTPPGAMPALPSARRTGRFDERTPLRSVTKICAARTHRGGSAYLWNVINRGHSYRDGAWNRYDDVCMCDVKVVLVR